MPNMSISSTPAGPVVHPKALARVWALIRFWTSPWMSPILDHAAGTAEDALDGDSENLPETAAGFVSCTTQGLDTKSNNLNAAFSNNNHNNNNTNTTSTSSSSSSSSSSSNSNSNSNSTSNAATATAKKNSHHRHRHHEQQRQRQQQQQPQPPTTTTTNSSSSSGSNRSSDLFIELNVTCRNGA